MRSLAISILNRRVSTRCSNNTSTQSQPRFTRASFSHVLVPFAPSTRTDGLIHAGSQLAVKVVSLAKSLTKSRIRRERPFSVPATHEIRVTARGSRFASHLVMADSPNYVKISTMSSEPSSLADWTPEQIAQGKRWVQAWKEAGPVMEQLRRVELRRCNAYQAIALLCGPADYRVPPRAPKPSSGLVEQQRWFMKAARHD